MKTTNNSRPTIQRKPTTKQKPQNYQINNFRYIQNVLKEKDKREQSSAIEKTTWSNYHTSALNKQEAEKYKY